MSLSPPTTRSLFNLLRHWDERVPIYENNVETKLKKVAFIITKNHSKVVLHPHSVLFKR